MASFADDTAVRKIDQGRYAASLSHSWDLARFPQGGVVVAIALRAAGAEVRDAAQRLRTCTTVFAGAVEAGDLEVAVNVLRHGRSATQVIVEVRNAGAAAGATTIAVFGSARTGPSFVDVKPPDVPPPAQCPSYRDPPPAAVTPPETLAFWQRIEGRAALGHPPWEPFEPVSSDVATWLRFDDPPLAPDGSLDPLGVVTLADRMPGSVGERIGHSGPRWFAPSADLTVHLFEPLRTEWVLAHDRARWADDGWASIETTMWDEAGQVIAYATQMVLFTYL
ncbi:MAG TPA: thioesterase family protein [Mycobacteriales bacterium]|jgi:acyl-CoA thioesterase|nr:thioesterase family protein [Mycobacteriales bacterium]